MAKGARGRKGPPAAKVERKFSLSAEAAERLDVHALRTRQRPAAVVEALILAHLRRFYVTDRGAPEGEGGCGGEAA